MTDNLIESWDRAAKVIADVLYNVYERDWMESASCAVDEPGDLSFIGEPTPQQEEKWAFICAHCPVFNECFAWGNREKISGAYIAGEWRE